VLPHSSNRLATTMIENGAATLVSRWREIEIARWIRRKGRGSGRSAQQQMLGFASFAVASLPVAVTRSAVARVCFVCGCQSPLAKAD